MGQKTTDENPQNNPPLPTATPFHRRIPSPVADAVSNISATGLARNSEKKKKKEKKKKRENTTAILHLRYSEGGFPLHFHGAKHGF